MSDHVWIPFIGCQPRYGVRHLSTREWLTYLDGDGYTVPFIVGAKFEARHRIESMDGGNGCEFWEVALMSDLDMAETKLEILRGQACRK